MAVAAPVHVTAVMTEHLGPRSSGVVEILSEKKAPKLLGSDL